MVSLCTPLPLNSDVGETPMDKMLWHRRHVALCPPLRRAFSTITLLILPLRKDDACHYVFKEVDELVAIEDLIRQQPENRLEPYSLTSFVELIVSNGSCFEICSSVVVRLPRRLG
jgi:hypothetical protein